MNSYFRTAGRTRVAAAVEITARLAAAVIAETSASRTVVIAEGSFALFARARGTNAESHFEMVRFMLAPLT